MPRATVLTFIGERAYWVTSGGHHIAIEDMTDDHIANALAKAERKLIRTPEVDETTDVDGVYPFQREKSMIEALGKAIAALNAEIERRMKSPGGFYAAAAGERYLYPWPRGGILGEPEPGGRDAK